MMLKTGTILGLGMLAVAGAAAGTPAEAGDRHARMLERIDTDGDGAISRQEMADFRAARFARLDSDADGRLTLDELQARAREDRATRIAKRLKSLTPMAMVRSIAPSSVPGRSNASCAWTATATDW